MKNLKFGVFCLGLAGMVGLAVSSLDAHPFDAQEPAARGLLLAQGEPAARSGLMMLDARGAQLGVMVSDQDSKAATGVKIDEVNPDSPAEKAGIKAGDVVIEFDGERVRSARQFTRLVQETPEGRAVAVVLLREGKKQTVNATPESGRMTWNFGGFGPEIDRAFREAERGTREFRRDGQGFNYRFDSRGGEPRRFEYYVPDGVFELPVPGSRFPSSRGRLGVTVQPITPELAEYFGAKNGGALVSSVAPESAAAKAGVKAGDVIVSVNGRSVSDGNDLARELEGINPSTALGAGGEATIVVLRDKKEMTIKATVTRPSAPRAGSRPGQ